MNPLMTPRQSAPIPALGAGPSPNGTASQSAPTGAVAAPPPPPPVAAPAVQQDGYTPHNKSFYYHAYCALLGPLVPAGYLEADARQAEKTAWVLARVVDSGTVPKGFIVPRVARAMGAIVEREILAAASDSRTFSLNSLPKISTPCVAISETVWFAFRMKYKST